MREGANLLEPHHNLHLAGVVFSAGRLWFESKEKPD